MKLFKSVILGVVFGAILVSVTLSQEDDKESLKDKILRHIEQKLKAEERQILDEVEELLDKELGKMAQPSTKKAKNKIEKPSHRGYLGVKPADLDEAKKRELKYDKDGGVLIEEPIEDTPAERAGIKEDDILLSVNGKSIESAKDLYDTIRSHKEGEPVKIKIWRDGKEQTVEVTLGTAPEDKNPQEDKE